MNAPTKNNAQDRRVLRRAWKSRKPYLRHVSSVPELQLVPPDRPLFTCSQCGFSNSQIPLCLWCAWSSESAWIEFERGSRMRRKRAISSPARVFSPCVPSEREARPRLSLAWTTYHSGSDPLGDTYGSRFRDSQFNDEGCTEFLGQPIVTATASELTNASDSPSFLQDCTRMNMKAYTSHAGSFEEAGLLSLDTKTTLNVKERKAASSVNRFMTQQPLTTCTPIIIDLTSQPSTEFRDDSKSPLLPPTRHACDADRSERALRRKKRMTVLRQVSSTSLRSRARGNHDRPPPLPLSQPQASLYTSPIETPRSDVLPFGHPSRPYYGAIRKNMVSPEQHVPTSTYRRARPTSMPAFVPRLHSALLDENLDYSLDDSSGQTEQVPLSARLRNHRASFSNALSFGASSRHRTSVSGEAELRMQLGSMRNYESLDHLADETHGDVKAKVKKLGRGLGRLKKLVLGRTVSG